MNAQKRLCDGVVGDFTRSRLHQHANAVRESLTGGVEDNQTEHIGADGVKVPQAAVGEPNDQRRDYDANRVDDIAQDVQVCRLNVEITLSLLLLCDCVSFFCC